MEIGPQFHFTLKEHAERIEREGFKVGGSSGYGNPEPVNNHGPGVYTAPKFAIENHWAGNIRNSPHWQDQWDRDKTEPEFAKVAVEHPPDARIHVVDSEHWYTRGGTRRPYHEGIARHLAEHPDVAQHYAATSGFGDRALAQAAKKAGYDAIHFPRDQYGAETVWFHPEKLRGRIVQ